jgi:LPS O-antigen subunit length determinant protein (WzzB/FepE family)
MPDDSAPKSAYEIAMERLRKSDEAAGVTWTAVTDEQKAAIGEVRNFYEAKLAEQEVLHQSARRRTADPAARETLDAEYRRDRERLTAERDAKIEKLRRAAPDRR